MSPKPSPPSVPIAAVLAAATAACLVELGLAYAQGTHRPAYFLASVAASLALAVLLAGLVAAFRRGPVAALTAWAGAAALLTGDLVLLAVPVVMLPLGRGAARAGVRATRIGVVSGIAFGVAVIAGLRARAFLPDAWPAGGTQTLLFAALLWAGLRGAQRLRPALPTPALLAPAVALLGLVAALAELDARRAPEAPPLHEGGGPHVFLLVLDTVRADRLSIYGYARETTPRLAHRVAEHPGATVYPWAFSNGSWTAPSHATLLTGLLPSEHEVHLGTPAAETMDWSLPTRFGLRAERTLAETFADAGHATIALFANLWLDRIDGLERGFEVYRRVRQRRGLPLAGEGLRRFFTPSWFLDAVHFVPTAPTINAELLRLVDANRDRPLFVLANYLDAHAPYRPPAGSRGRFADWSPFERPQQLRVDLADAEIERLGARYDESIHGLDAALDDLLEALDARGILDDAWVFVTSDHGEAFREHGVTDHGTGIYNEQVRVPLVVLPPRGVRMGDPGGPVSLASVAATAAAIAGAPLPHDADLRQGGPGAAVIEFYADPSKAKSQGRLGEQPAQAVVVGREKLVRYRDRSELFDLAVDPGERDDLSSERRERVRALSERLPEIDFTRAESAAPTGELDDRALRKQLEALGYLEEE